MGNEKGKGVSVHIVKTYRGSGGVAPPILNLGYRSRWLVSLTPGCLSSGKKFPVPIKYEAEWVPGLVSTSRRRHRYLVPAGIQIPDFLVRSLEVSYKSIIYNKPTRCKSGSIVFIKNYKYALHVSDALCVHLQEHYKFIVLLMMDAKGVRNM